MKWSAILIARNEGRLIGKTLTSIMTQSIKPYRVLVLDDMSEDDTAEAVTKHGAEVMTVPECFGAGRKWFYSLAKKRDYGLRVLVDDPVDWIYSGDADMVLPPRYCEVLTSQAATHNAVVCAGIERGKHDLLPMEGCQMLHRTWVKQHDVHLKYESIYVCCQALATGHATLVSYLDDCAVSPQRPTGKNYTNSRIIDSARLMKNMGASNRFMVWKTASICKAHGLRHAWAFFNMWRTHSVLESAGIRHAYQAILSDRMQSRLLPIRRGREGVRSIFTRHDDHAMVCRI